MLRNLELLMKILIKLFIKSNSENESKIIVTKKNKTIEQFAEFLQVFVQLVFFNFENAFTKTHVVSSHLLLESSRRGELKFSSILFLCNFLGYC